YYGGFYNTSPVKLIIPYSGFWNVTVDLGGRRGLLGSTLNIVPKPIPKIQEADISSIMERALQSLTAKSMSVIIQNKTHDVFISHATEDKNEVARPLAEILRSAGLNVWYDEFELRIGSNLRQMIDKGLADSRFGIVVLSEAFFNKNWPQYELDGLVSREISGEQIILPIWHKVSKAEVLSYSPPLANRVGRNTSSYTLDEIADEIVRIVRPVEEEEE
ncbi:MAG TPA: DUF1883 domain-containing protein, partial [Thermodesulfobacteriota bacterium]